MFRACSKFCKVSRSWTPSAASSIRAAAHFPREVQADPATLRTAASGPKEQRQWTLGVEEDAFHRMPKYLQKITNGTKLYCEMVRFYRPGGWLFLVIPCFWGSSLAVTRALVWEGADPVALFAPFIPFHLVVSFVAGAYLMRSAGCVVNDYCDRNLDDKVARTVSRPFACGKAGKKEAALVVVSHVGLAGIIALNLAPAALATCLLITPVWVTYPLMKRLTYFPQIPLGICYNCGIFVGYAAVLGRVDWAVCLPIYLGAVLWVLLYDTIYAYQDIRDDKKCGIKSSAIVFGDNKQALYLLIIPVVCGILASGAMAPQATPFYVGALMCTYYLYHVVDDVNIYDPWSCTIGFMRNIRFGFAILAAMCFGNLVWAMSSEHEVEQDADHDSVASSSPLHTFLTLNQKKATPQYDAEHFSWLDRLLHPAFVQAEVARTRGDEEAPPIPTWMRREYIGENVSTIMRFCGMSEESIKEWTQWWYGSIDHYNMFSKIQL